MGRAARCFPGAASAFDYAFQFLLAVVLVRCLDTVAFDNTGCCGCGGDGEAIVTMAMPGSLYYFLRDRRRDQTPLHQPGAPVLAVLRPDRGWAVSSWKPGSGKDARSRQHDAVVPLFVLLWLVASLSICCPRRGAGM